MLSVTLRPLIAAVALLAGPAAAQGPLAPEAYIPAMTEYLKGIAHLRAVQLKCIPDAPAKDWDAATGSVVATLWSANYPDAFVESVDELLTPPPAAVDCAAEAGVDYARYASSESWAGFIAPAFKDLGLTVVPDPPPGSWDQIAALFAREVPRHARLIECIAVTAPPQLIYVVTDWNNQLLIVGQRLAAAGYPRGPLVEAITAADPNAIWTPVADADRAALVADCAKDESWSKMYYEFDLAGLRIGIDDILGAQQ